jgi:dihydrolipoamide dehydrogenase
MYDLIVLGAGPGGYVAALRASQLGMKVALIEKESLGGVCLNWGCIPTKSLLESAKVFASFKDASKYGLAPCNSAFEMKPVVARSRAIVDTLTSGVKGLLAKNGVKVVFGSGSFTSPDTIRVTTSSGTLELKASKIIISTGARARSLKGFDHELVWSYKDAMMAENLPKRLTIIGGGVIGMEFASMYSDFGCKVQILEAASRILPGEDVEISSFMHSAFVEKGIEIACNVSIVGQKKSQNEVEIEFTQLGKSKSCKSDKVLVCIGVRPNSDFIGLEHTSVTVDDAGAIKTDSYLRTDDSKIYAIGDVTYGPWLAHKASREAIICIEKICGLEVEPINRGRIPSCVYSSPQCASIGLTEEKARSEVAEIKVGRFPFHGNGKALASSQTDGFAKVILDARSGEMLGVHMAGHGVTELIHSASLAMQLETTEAEILNTIFPHPTLSEVFQESVLDALGRPMHK